MEKFIQLGKEFGLEGEKLLEFVKEREDRELEQGLGGGRERRKS